MNLKSLIRTVPNYPKPGILFRDITTILYNGKALKYISDIYFNRYKDKNITAIAGIEARGFIFGAIIAERLGISFVPIRKKNKLPSETHSVDFKLEYGEATIEVHKDSIDENDKVLIIDDLIATGGTAEAAAKLVEISKGKVAAFIFVINLFDLNGTDKLLDKGYKVENLIDFPGH